MARYLTNAGCRPGSDGSDDPQSIEDYVVEMYSFVACIL